MTRYAERTEVAPEKSRTEIERTLSRYGATSFAYGWSGDQAMIGFEYNHRSIRFILPMPSPDSSEFTRTPTGRQRSASAARSEYEQAVRQRWRALALVIKAKLEAVQAGIVTFEDEFMAHMLLPDGSRVGDRVNLWVNEAYRLGTVPPLALPESC